MDYLVWGALLRFCQALLAATPTILVGFVLAGVFRCMLGHAGTRRLFGSGTKWSLLQAWLIGMLLPVCSLGVIPVAREMRRAGISGGVILAFALTAPLFNPISLLYGLTLADPIVIFTFSFCSLVIVTVAGAGWDQLFKKTADAEPEPPVIAQGAKRILAVISFAARELFSTTTIYILIGLIGVAGLSLVLPAGALQTTANQNDLWAPAYMGLIAIPLYATPMTAMVQLASMFQHGNSVGAAFALLALGAGANLGLVAWMIRAYGLRRSTIWIAMLFAIVLGLAYGIGKPLYPKAIDPAMHTHAFDMYCAPFRPGQEHTAQKAVTIFRENIAPHEIVALGFAGALLTIGLILIVFDKRRRLDGWFEKQPQAKGKYDVELSGPVLGIVSLLGLVALSVAGVYIYYPPPNEILAEMKVVDTQVASAAMTRDWEETEYWIPRYDDWTRKLQVSMFLRGEPLTPYRRAKANVLRSKLEELEHCVEEEDASEAKRLGLDVTRAYSRMKAAYQD